MTQASPIPLPSQHQSGTNPYSNLAPVLLDDRAIAAVVDQLLARAGISQAEACRRMGIQPATLNQYRLGRRVRPSVWWLVRLAQVCGAKILVEYPAKGVV